MKRLATLAAAAMLLTTLTGCMDITTLISVKKDGSGNIIQTIYLNAMMSAMSAMGDGGGMTPELAELEQGAAKMGDGVRYVSHKNVTRDDGSKGYRVVYAFDDVTTLNVDPMPSSNDDDDGAVEEKDGLQFDFKPGAAPTLTVRLPNEDDGEPDEFDEIDNDVAAEQDEQDEQDDDNPAMDAMGAQMEAQMKQMFQGFRIRAMIRVDGEITDSNASFVQEGRKSGVKQYVTLYDMDLGKMVNNPDQLEKLQGLQNSGQDFAALTEQMKDIDGLKIETEPAVKITFK